MLQGWSLREDAPDGLNFAMCLAQHYEIIPRQTPFIASVSPRLSRAGWFPSSPASNLRYFL